MFSKRPYLFILIILMTMLPFQSTAIAKKQTIYQKRMALYKKTAAITQIPWYYLAAIDQYARNKKKDDHNESLISISIPSELWYGLGNTRKANDEHSIKLFGGIGKDGNGDKVANIKNPNDVLYTMAEYLLTYGPTHDDIKIALWHFYKRDLTVQTIMNTAKVFKKFQKLNLTKRSFPVPLNYNHSYANTWGDRRGFGGLRIHEGTDIFSGYGTPVLATTYGVVEMKGWNRYGGWRLGVRDIYNIYHYYAHLSSYNKRIKLGQVVKPGDMIGHVGSTGYGPPGTAGKFPPHLHYGMYKDNGHHEWSFDPYPYLKKWERMERQS